MDVNYIGEHLWAGYAGRTLILAAFLSSLFSVLLYYNSIKRKSFISGKAEPKADLVFIIHSVSLFVASFLLLYILLNRFYEYRYVWIHAENSLSAEYLIAAFWAGQEGSLLFWALCQAVFGLLLIRFSGHWKPYVMMFIGLSQFFMTSMLLGISIGNLQIGMSPFLLLREAGENLGNAFFANPNYLQFIQDGNGLNPLLRNFWMLSHPPVLFVGFAAALIPFAYCLSGLWRKQYYEWIRPALPWTLLSVFFLGAGLILGGVWAYESLTFGGFWAWDPIENASLVPWLILIASLHLMVLARKKRNTFLPAFLFTTMSFLFVIYSTFLTRSGILAETSVHSFGDDGMGMHILLYIIVFLLLSLILLIKNNKNFPVDDNKNLFSKEFWLFMSMLIILLSAFHIIFTTSIPVFNKLFGANLAPPIDVVAHYNKWQAPFAIILALLLSISHYLDWGQNSIKNFFKSAWFPIILAVISFIITSVFYPITNIVYQLMLVFAFYAFYSSLDNLLRFNNKYISIGGIISHMGFALFLIAIIFTFSKQEIISKNTSGYFLGDSFSEQENLLLIKDEILPMGDYFVKYTGNQYDGERIIYSIDFLKKNKKGDFYKAFSSFPAVLLNENMGNVYEPFSKVFILKDVFTYITYAEIDKDISGELYDKIGEIEVLLNDTVIINNDIVIFKDLASDIKDDVVDLNNIIINAELELITHFGNSFTISPKYELSDGEIIFHDHKLEELSLLFRFKEVSENPYTIVVEVFEYRDEFIVIKTIIFPFINLLWLSLIIILAGILIAAKKRWKTRNKIQKNGN